MVIEFLIGYGRPRPRFPKKPPQTITGLPLSGNGATAIRTLAVGAECLALR
jgi:hypothetical protein